MSWKTFALIIAFGIALTQGTRAADRIVPPAVPTDIEVQGPYKPFLWGHAIGTQNYICAPAPTASGRDWLFIGPQATVYDADGEQILTHFQSRNPWQDEAIQAMWQHSRDSSGAWATRHSGSLDANYVAAGAIEWLLLDVTGAQIGPTGGDRLAKTKFIQRVNTVGGVKPPTSECTAEKLNTRRLVLYEADYYFYQ